MLKLITFALIVSSIGCGASSNTRPEPAPSQEEEPSSAVEPEPIPSETEGAAEPEPKPAHGGRMAFTQCEAGPRTQACTKDYRPVCGEVDNGKRCITTPCDSTDQKEFSNACTACADAKTSGYWPVACAELGSDSR